MKTKLPVMLMTLVMLLCLCAGTMAESAFPVTVTDALGREVTIEAEPQRIVSGYYIATSMLMALGKTDCLVGIEAKAAQRPIYALAAPQLLELPNVGTAKNFDLEGCAALEPELVVLPAKLRDVVPALEALGIPVIAINPESFAQMGETVALLGKATGAGARAQALIEDMTDKLKKLETLLADANRPTVYLAGNSSYLSTAGAKMAQNALIGMAGGENVAGALEDSYWATVSYEQLLAWDPDVIVIVPEADYTKEELMADAQLSGLRAVREGRVYAMPSSVEAWDSPVPAMTLGSLWLAGVLHPDRYDSFAEDAATFYRAFYRIELEPEQLLQ